MKTLLTHQDVCIHKFIQQWILQPYQIMSENNSFFFANVHCTEIYWLSVTQSANAGLLLNAGMSEAKAQAPVKPHACAVSQGFCPLEPTLGVS